MEVIKINLMNTNEHIEFGVWNFYGDRKNSKAEQYLQVRERDRQKCCSLKIETRHSLEKGRRMKGVCQERDLLSTVVNHRVIK